MKPTIYYVDYDADDDDGVVLMVMSTVVCGPYPGTFNDISTFTSRASQVLKGIN